MSKPLNIHNQMQPSTNHQPQQQNESQQGVNQNQNQNQNTAEKVVSTISQEFQNFLADAERLFKSFTSLTGAELEIAKTEFNERLASARAVIANVRTTVTEQAKSKMAIADNYVHEKPWKAVGASAAVGVLLGFALTRRK